MSTLALSLNKARKKKRSDSSSVQDQKLQSPLNCSCELEHCKLHPHHAQMARSYQCMKVTEDPSRQLSSWLAQLIALHWFVSCSRKESFSYRYQHLLFEPADRYDGWGECIRSSASTRLSRCTCSEIDGLTGSQQCEHSAKYLASESQTYLRVRIII